jgi:hypothetical protein
MLSTWSKMKIAYEVSPYIENGLSQWVVWRIWKNCPMFAMDIVSKRLAIVNTEDQARALVEHVKKDTINL